MDYSEGIKALVTGMTTVFIVLILISTIISLFKYLNRTSRTPGSEVKEQSFGFTKDRRETDGIKDSEGNRSLTALVNAEKNMNELELIAVLTAAVAASMNTPVDRLRVTSFRKIGSSKAWKKT